MSAWTDHVARWRDCQACPLGKQRNRIVLARGTLPADVVFVGEAPGASEDATGLPFYGPAGYLLDQIIERALPPTVSYVLTNLVACFPRLAKEAGDNEPERSEILACRPRLVEFIDIARPKLVVRVGSLAAEYTSRADDGMRYADIVHPAAILRMPLAKKNMALQRAVVILRNVVEDMLQSKTNVNEQPTAPVINGGNGVGLAAGIVAAREGKGKYLTTADSCCCPDRQYRNRVCKHMQNVREGREPTE